MHYGFAFSTGLPNASANAMDQLIASLGIEVGEGRISIVAAHADIRRGIGVLLLLLVAPVCGQKVSIDAAVRTSDKPYVQAMSQATLSVKPDRATIEVGVITQGTTAAVVASENAKQTDAVLAGLRRVVGTTDQLQTINYSVRPNYQAPKPGSVSAISGFVATNVVEVTLNDLAELGKVIDAVLQSGANNIQRLEFGLKNPQAVRSQALHDAAAHAKANAQAIAAGSGVRILRTISVEELEPSEDLVGMKKAVPPPPPGAASIPVQIQAGSIEVTATVTLRAEVEQ